MRDFFGRKSTPLVSVIIATFNWSAALRLAVQSVLRQTFADFELLVVGDACTDDSESVIRAFRDKRIRWFNLPSNNGSQWAPNNFGIERAAGRYIAYLGHDDLWWPTHLETLVATAQRCEADVVAALTIMYGPPGSGIRATTGLFPAGQFAPRYFFPPSSLLHSRALIDRAGPWRSPAESRRAVDYDLLQRFHECGARFASTEELTAFKFNAAWRRNSYKNRDVSEQAAMLARMGAEGEALRQTELVSVIRSVIENRFVPIEMPPETAPPAIVNHRLGGSFKGSLQREAAAAPLPAEGLRFFVDDTYSAYEWHYVEENKGRRWRWTGPGQRSSFYLPVTIDRPARIAIRLLWVMASDPEAALDTAQLILHDRPLPTERKRQADGSWIWSADLDPGRSEGRPIEMLTIFFPQPRRPLDLGMNEERRWLGLAVSEMEIRPL